MTPFAFRRPSLLDGVPRLTGGAGQAADLTVFGLPIYELQSVAFGSASVDIPAPLDKYTIFSFFKYTDVSVQENIQPPQFIAQGPFTIYTLFPVNQTGPPAWITWGLFVAPNGVSGYHVDLGEVLTDGWHAFAATVDAPGLTLHGFFDGAPCSPDYGPVDPADDLTLQSGAYIQLASSDGSGNPTTATSFLLWPRILSDAEIYAIFANTVYP